MKLLKVQKNQKGKTPTCSCISPKHLHNLWPPPILGVQCSLHQQFMALPASTELTTAALCGTGAGPPILVPAPQEVFLAYCTGDARKSYYSAKPSCIIYFAFHHVEKRAKEQHWVQHSVPSWWTHAATSVDVLVDSCNCNSSCTHISLCTPSSSQEWVPPCNSRSLGLNNFNFLLGILKVLRSLLSM